LVRRSYRDPLETWSTNVLGTANLLESCRLAKGLQAIVVITTDKVYRNEEWAWGYRESDALGGHDPYSASKACTELVVSSFRQSFFNRPDSPLLSTVRAGNVIGGGDWSEDRLIPDVVRSIIGQQPLEIRSPNATRPWQHVLESLSGYLMIGEKLLAKQTEFARAWNFGPNAEDNRRVVEVLNSLKNHWPKIEYSINQVPQPHEANLLFLDNSLAKSKLGWRPVWTLDRTIQATADWYRRHAETNEIASRQQLSDFTQDASEKQMAWAQA
jgi:CDP-glucose 4,6-dehydratase